MTATVAPPRAAAPKLTSLTRSEVLRARSRRSLFWLSIVGVLGVVAIAALMWFTSAHVTQADLDEAADRFLAEQTVWYEQCLADSTIPDEQCWKPTEEDARTNAIWNLERRPFGQDGVEGLVSLAGGIGLLFALLLAATTGGADWAARTMGLTLSWEPRRTRVFLVRLVIAVLVAVALAAVLLAVALALSWMIASAHDLEPSAAAALAESYQPANLSETLDWSWRWLPVAALAATASFAVAMLTRSTGWAVGALIGYVSVVESMLQGLWPWGSQFLIQTNMGAWLSGGAVHLVDRAAAEASGNLILEDQPTPGYITITDTRGLTTLAIVVWVVGLISWLSFRARDVE